MPICFHRNYNFLHSCNLDSKQYNDVSRYNGHKQVWEQEQQSLMVSTQLRWCELDAGRGSWLGEDGSKLGW